MKEKFEELKKNNPETTPTIILFGKLVKGRNMNKGEIRKWFNKLVEKEDWEGSSKEEILSFYHRLSNGLE